MMGNDDDVSRYPHLCYPLTQSLYYIVTSHPCVPTPSVITGLSYLTKAIELSV